MGLLLLVGPVSVQSAAAARIHAHVSGIAIPGDASAFDLHIAREEMELDYDDSGAGEDLRTLRVGIGLFEALSPSARVGLRLGRVAFDQSGRAATAGRAPTGYFAELEFSGTWPDDTRLRGFLGANWRYSTTDESDRDTDVEVEVDWQTLELRPALWLALNARMALRLGVSAIALDGSERLSGGPTRRTVDFEAAESAGAFATLEYHRADADVIRARLRGGNPAGLYLAFEHRY